jgi:hypothetical protein
LHFSKTKPAIEIISQIKQYRAGDSALEHHDTSGNITITARPIGKHGIIAAQLPQKLDKQPDRREFRSEPNVNASATSAALYLGRRASVGAERRA